MNRWSRVVVVDNPVVVDVIDDHNVDVDGDGDDDVDMLS